MEKLSNMIKWGAGAIVSLPAVAIYLLTIQLQALSYAQEPQNQESVVAVWPTAEQTTLQLAETMAAMDALQQQQNAATSIATPQPASNEHTPQIGVAANGVTVIKITPPNAQGVSYNRYLEFETKPEGIVIANNPQEVMTELAGVLPANGILNGRASTLIINELVAGNQNKMELRGPIEVAGAEAALIFASGNGINTQNCRFINSHNVTLTTGKLEFELGQLSGYQIEDGDIQIRAQGMQAAEGQVLNLLTTALYFMGDASANTLMIVSGKTHISSDLVTISPMPATYSAHREGLMLNGVLTVSHGVVIKTYKSNVNNNESLVAKTITIESDGSLKNFGQILSQGDIKIDSKGGVRNSNMMKAVDNLEIKSVFISNSKGAMDQGEGLLFGGKTLQLIAEDAITNNATMMTNGDGWFSAKSMLNSSKATLVGENIHFGMPQEAVENLGQLKAKKIHYSSPIPIAKKSFKNEGDVESQGLISDPEFTPSWWQSLCSRLRCK